MPSRQQAAGSDKTAAKPPGGKRDQVLTAETPVCLATPDAVADFSLRMPDAPTPEQAQAVIAQEAMRWTYVLRSRRRWIGEKKTRERNELAARDALNQIGIDDAEIAQLAASDCVVVRVPWTGQEALHWESRVLPWEYLIAAATRRERLQGSEDGRARALTVMREMRLLTRAGPVPPDAATLFAQGGRMLVVECMPPELDEYWDLEGEHERLRAALPGAQWHVLNFPTPDELKETIAKVKPQFIHFAGLDSHLGLKELRHHVGTEALVDLGMPDEAPGEAAGPAMGSIRRVEDVTADKHLALDGVLLRGSPVKDSSRTATQDGMSSAADPASMPTTTRSYPRLVPAHELAKTLAASGHCALLVTFNFWNSAARIAPLVVAERGALAAVGFQDAFDDALAEYVYGLLYEELVRQAWNIPRAFQNMWTAVRDLPEAEDATGITLWAGQPLLLRHVPAPARPAAPAEGHNEELDQAVPLAQAPSDEPPVEVHVRPFRELNYAVLHNGQPLFDSFVIECETPGPDVKVDVDVSVHMGTETARFRRRVKLNKRRVTLTRDVHVPLTAALIRGAHEAISSSLVVEVIQGAKTLYRDSHRLRLLPVDQWRDNQRDGRWLPSFVQPRDSAVARALEQAQRYVKVLRDDPSAGFEGYQLAVAGNEPSLCGVDRQVEAIWAALLHDWRLGYINPPPTYSAALDSQRLRLPSAVWQQRAGTCIDLALLLAACLEYVDIYPVVFLLEGHALPGWWRHADYRDEYLDMPQASSTEVAQVSATENPMANAQVVSWHAGKASWPEVRRWIRQRKLVPIETVRLTEHCGFVEAVEAGVAALSERRDYDSMLEIITARREGVTPLPVQEG